MGHAGEGCCEKTQIDINTQHNTILNHVETLLLAVSPATAYHVVGSVRGKEVRFMLDTGAAISLISDRTWGLIDDGKSSLANWDGHKLVGVEGSAIPILGVAQNLNINFAGVEVNGDFIVASTLNSEAILGLDFLERHQCCINTEQKVLHLKGRALRLSRNANPSDVGREVNEAKVVVQDQVILPPRSVLEIMAKVETPAIQCDCVFLLEGLSQQPNVVVANALVTPQWNNETASVPVRLLNTSTDSVVLHKGKAVACASTLDRTFTAVASATEMTEEPTLEATPKEQELLWGLVEDSGNTLDMQQKHHLFNLLLGYVDVFALTDDQLGRTKQLKHTINTGDHRPIRQPARRIPPCKREEVHQLLQDMLGRKVIQPSTSPWASPIVLVKKKDGSTRFCIDYRKINAITHKDAYPLPRIDDTLDTLSGAQWFSTLDLLSGYWQVEVAEEDKPKTAFATREGLYEFNVMPFGLCNAPATFQRLMDLVLAGVQWTQCLVYLDDVIVIGRDFEEHLHNLSVVLQKLKEAGLRLKPRKCSFCRESVSYLGHIVSREGVSTDPEKTAKVTSWPTPTSVQAVQQFLGLASYYRRFVRNFAEIAKPLHRLTERGRDFTWTVECETAFATLKYRLSSAPILSFPDFSKPFILDTDASQEGIGAVLSQICEGNEQVIAYASRTLSKAERKYSVTRKELLAVVVFTKHFRPYLLGRNFALRTDHSSLTWLQNFKEPEGQLARWIEKLQEYNFTILHRQGKQHQNADALSRRPDDQDSKNQNSSDLEPQLKISMTSLSGEPSSSAGCSYLRKEQLEDENIGFILKAKETQQKPDAQSLKAKPREAHQLSQLWDQLVVKEGILYRQFEESSGKSSHLQLIIPRQLREEVLEEAHAGTMSCHLGEDKTIARVREKFFWPGYSNAAKEWCKTCANCATRKIPPRRRRGPLQNILTGYPMQMVATDIMGPFPTTTNGNKYILVASDYFTKWVEAYAIPNQEATTVAGKLVDNMFCHFGLPEQLHSDMGAQFESRVVKEMCTMLHINKTHTTPYHPQGDGLVERANRTIQNMLTTATNSQGDDWENCLPKVCLAYNTSKHASTGYTPFYLMFGRQPHMPLDVIYGVAPSHVQEHCQYVANLRRTMESAYCLARKNMQTAAYRQKENYDLKIHGDNFKPGQLVWLCNPVVPKGNSKKLHAPWVGPYKVIKCLSDTVYRIQDTRANRRRQVVHFDRLKPCPENIRIKAKPDVPGQRASTAETPTQSSRPPPPGTMLQLVEDHDDTEAVRENNLPNVLANPEARRYPMRSTRRRPVRYGDD